MSGTFGKHLRSVWGAVGSNWGAFGELLDSIWKGFEASEEFLDSI